MGNFVYLHIPLEAPQDVVVVVTCFLHRLAEGIIDKALPDWFVLRVVDESSDQIASKTARQHLCGFKERDW